MLLDQFGKKIRKPLGEQLIDNAISFLKGTNPQDTGSTVEAIWKNINNQMNEGIQKSRKKGFKGPIYIQIKEMELNHNFGTKGGMFPLVFRRTRPTPEPASHLFIHRHGDENAKHEYSLPELSWVDSIMRDKNSGKFTAKYINDIQAWITGTLK
jgi:hypothetical protein